MKKQEEKLESMVEREKRNLENMIKLQSLDAVKLPAMKKNKIHRRNIFRQNTLRRAYHNAMNTLGTDGSSRECTDEENNNKASSPHQISPQVGYGF